MLRVTAALAALLWSGLAIAQGIDSATPALLGHVGGIKDAAHTRDMSLNRLSQAARVNAVLAAGPAENAAGKSDTFGLSAILCST